MTTRTHTGSAARFTTRELVIDALFIALTFVFTMFVNIRLPIAGNGGLIHLGNVPFFLAAILFGRWTGAIVGSIGMALFDLTSGWAAWAPFTFVIVGCMGLAVGTISGKKNGESFLWNLVSLLVALVIKVCGYYFTEVILYGNWIVPFGSVPGNLIQIGVAALITLPLVPAFQKTVSFLKR